ncbi:hypothetical protein HPP92_020679 [Vanilla planifolia]|uniref:Uncharacterized protein n=1 Tax=Vanilla planifolia TaxID=51239 RepID=A0A835UI30_VANPL|nr:hypothetical protein HPP92_020679 [Vanilla planifolia]
MEVGAVASMRYVKDGIKSCQAAGKIAVGVAVYKWVGDGPMAGSSAYADMRLALVVQVEMVISRMRFLPCYQVVESMRQGMEPKHAAAEAISRIARKYPGFVGAVFALDKNGLHAGASMDGHSNTP